MTAAGSAAGSGVVLGIVGVLLAQQFAYLELDSIPMTIEWLVVAAVVGGVVCGIVGWGLGRRHLRAAREAAP